jgi:glycosyltransferase involved in cell wall biosynthesis
MTINNPQVCQVVASINQDIGGPAYSVTHLAESLTDYQINSHLFTLDYSWHGQQLAVKNAKLHSLAASKIAKYFRGWQPQAFNYLDRLATNELAIIHNHGLWMFPNCYARKIATKHQLPLVISPRGMLESWSLKHSRAKKYLAWLLYERQNLTKATVFHATSSLELESIRKLGYQQPIALIPNGITLPQYSQSPAKDTLINLFPELAGKNWLLFLSRIHPKKGLEDLLLTWQKLSSQFPDWHLIIAGSDLIGYQQKLQELTQILNLTNRVTFTGMLSGETKASALNNADLFILPTYSENFGIAIAESLAHSVPVITTKNAPWQDLIQYDCGWWIDNNLSVLETTLTKALTLSKTERKLMGENGKKLVVNNYSWHSIAEQMSQVYHWILHKSEIPNCIYL